MSKLALSKYLDEVLASIPVAELGRLATSKERTNTESFRRNLNKTIHILIINEYFIKALAPRAEEILKSLPSAIGRDGNASAVRAVLAEYRALRGNKRGKVRKKQVELGGEPGYILTFPSFDAVRAFLNRLGLSGRSSEILNFVKTNPDIKARLAALLGTEIFTNESTLVSAISQLNPANNKSKTSPFYNNKEAADIYRIIYDQDLGFDVGHNIPVAYKQVELFASNKAALKLVVERFTTAISGNTKLTSSGINSVVREVQQAALTLAKKTAIENKFVVEKSELNAKGRAGVTVFIESSKANQETESEARIINEFKELLLSRIKAQLRGKDAALKLLNQKGSKTYIEQTLDIVSDSITNKVQKPKGTSVGKFNHKSKIDTNVISAKSKKSSSQNVRVLPLRTKKGRFTSLIGLEAVLRELINETVEKNMQRPHLEYQTGRFANSVEVIRLQRTRDDEVTAFLTYMKYPYQTFEPGFRQGHKGYDPRILLDKSVREILAPLVAARLRTQVL